MMVLVLVHTSMDIRRAVERVARSVTVRIDSPSRAHVETFEGRVTFVVVQGPRDVDRFHGMRYDIVIEHESFNPNRSAMVGQAADAIRHMVIR